MEDYNSIDYPYEFKQAAWSFMPLRLQRSSKSSIIQECCFKPCYMSELKGYCANN